MGKKTHEMTLEELSVISAEAERICNNYDREFQAIRKRGEDSNNTVALNREDKWIPLDVDKRNKLFALKTTIDTQIEKRLLEIYGDIFEKN